MVNTLLLGRMDKRSASDRVNQAELDRKLREIGPSEAVTRLIDKYGSLSTRKNYAIVIALYLRWLKGKGITLSPDQLIQDNLLSIFKSDPTDVRTKRKHTDWLDQFVNGHMVEDEYSESERRLAAAAIKQFYQRNDSLLFGDFEVSRQRPREPAKPLKAEDIRQVLKALPINTRTPLLCLWQSSVEINRVLSLTWNKLEGMDQGEYPLKLEFYGRKRHRSPYHTYLGKNSVQHLTLWREKRNDFTGRDPSPDDLVFVGKRGTGASMEWLNQQLK